MTTVVSFIKGHGTGNDFVILPDDEAQLHVTIAQIRHICDRHLGIGADGILRVVPAALSNEPEVVAQASVAHWFMDYRNSDGSIAEMCGNGVRVFAHYLFTTHRAAGDEVFIATRGGIKRVYKTSDGLYAVEMGRWQPIPTLAPVAVHIDEQVWSAMAVAMPNPHAVVFVEDLNQAGTLLNIPLVTPAETYPDGVNVEFVVERGNNHVAMRVYERGVGETLSCGTGACAVAIAARRRVHAEGDTRWQVDVPGGTLWIEENDDREITLVGPAEIVAEGTITLLGTHEF